VSTYPKSPYDLDDEEFASLVDELSVWSAPFGLKLLDTIILREGISVLDIGCGPGFPLVEVALRLGKTCTVYGIDPWKAAAARARKKIEAFGLTNVHLIDGVAEELPLPDHSIDLIVSNNGINNVQDLPRVLRECARVARDGAQFVATVNLPETMTEFYGILTDVVLESGLAELVPKIRQHIHHKRKPVGELESLFRISEFGIRRVAHASFRFRYLDGSAMISHPFIRYAFMESWIALLPPERSKELLEEAELRMNRRAHEAGEWDLTIPFIVIDASREPRAGQPQPLAAEANHH